MSSEKDRELSKEQYYLRVPSSLLFIIEVEVESFMHALHQHPKRISTLLERPTHRSPDRQEQNSREPVPMVIVEYSVCFASQPRELALWAVCRRSVFAVFSENREEIHPAVATPSSKLIRGSSGHAAFLLKHREALLSLTPGPKCLLYTEKKTVMHLYRLHMPPQPSRYHRST